MKKQIWVETNELNAYLKDGWTHIFRQDGTLLSRLCGTMKEYYLLEKEEVKDTEETIMPEGTIIFCNGKDFIEVCGPIDRLFDFRSLVAGVNTLHYPKMLSISYIKKMAKDQGLKVINEEER